MYYGFQFSFDFLQFSDSFQLVGVGGGGGGGSMTTLTEN